MISRVPSSRWLIASERISSSVTTPPALRMTCASPSCQAEDAVDVEPRVHARDDGDVLGRGQGERAGEGLGVVGVVGEQLVGDGHGYSGFVEKGRTRRATRRPRACGPSRGRATPAVELHGPTAGPERLQQRRDHDVIQARRGAGGKAAVPDGQGRPPGWAVFAHARGRGRGAVFRGSTAAGGAPEPEEPAVRDDRHALAEDATVPPDLRDRLLLAFTELAMYGIAAEEDVRAEPELARAEIAALLRMRAPHGLGRTCSGSAPTRPRCPFRCTRAAPRWTGRSPRRAAVTASLCGRAHGPECSSPHDGAASTARSSQTRSRSGMPSRHHPGRRPATSSAAAATSRRRPRSSA